MNPDRPTSTSAANDASAVRPRNRRLISYCGENDSRPEAVGSSTSLPPAKAPSPFPSRGVSPLPEAHPSRPPVTAVDAGWGRQSSSGQRGNRHGQVSASSGLGLWESWSSLQGIASTLLGSDAQQTTKGKSTATLNAPLWRKASKGSSPRPRSPQWGPRAGTGQDLTPGSKEERQAMVQAKKREALLLADANETSNLATLHKRRVSDLNTAAAAPPSEQEGDALVYVHKIKPQDTLAGVMIRYQCQPAVFRKVNRLWPNDNIQIRRHVFLPVEACALRGKKIETTDHRFEDKPSGWSTTQQPSPKNKSSLFDLDAEAVAPSPSLNPSHERNLEPEYKHEYYVSLPNIPESIEIARIPRRTLGFFPPSRRKSQTISDADLHSPTPSLEIGESSSRLTNTTSTSPSPSRSRTNAPPRRNSISNSSHFLNRLHGPGGVGTLHPSGPKGGPVIPGPAQDRLNKMFAHRLPNVAPPPSPSSASSASLMFLSRTAGIRDSTSATTGGVRESFESIRSGTSTSTTGTGAGLENVGGVIEGWVRKVGTRLRGELEPSEAYRQRARGRGAGRRGTEAWMGDLIELESTDISGEVGLVGEGQERRGGGTAGKGERAGVTSIAAHDGVARGAAAANAGVAATKRTTSTEESSLRERFPPRTGRMSDDADADAHTDTHHSNSKRK